MHKICACIQPIEYLFTTINQSIPYMPFNSKKIKMQCIICIYKIAKIIVKYKQQNNKIIIVAN